MFPHTFSKCAAGSLLKWIIAKVFWLKNCNVSFLANYSYLLLVLWGRLDSIPSVQQVVLNLMAFLTNLVAHLLQKKFSFTTSPILIKAQL